MSCYIYFEMLKSFVIPCSGRQRPQSVGTTTSISSVNQKAQPRSSTPNKKGLDTTQPDPTTTTATQNLTATPKRKGDSVSQTTPAKRGRKEKDKTKEKQNKDDSFMLVSSFNVSIKCEDTLEMLVQDIIL